MNDFLEVAIGRPFYTDGCRLDVRCQFEVSVSLALICLQVSRRLYECLFVSVFSPTASMHLLHYALGMYFYTAIGPTALLTIGTGEEGCGLHIFVISN